MPGLCGIIGSPHDASASDRFSVMLQRMKHHHWYQVDAYQDISQGLALARISLGFVQTAPQPAWDADRTVCVVMDGELYGKPASNIEPSSINGHGRRETSDAELLLAGYLQEGADFFRKLNGTFAAAIWDSRIRRLVLTNDRFGMKPLYYARVPGKFLIASEIKSLLADPAVSRQPNPRGIRCWRR
jgi:asparagine synthase (glutamine-hydrolysing)